MADKKGTLKAQLSVVPPQYEKQGGGQAPEAKKFTPPTPSNMIQLSAHKCAAEDCKQKPARAGFCDEHYNWFKEGLLTLEGYKAKDFDKKYHSMMRRKQQAA